MTEKDRISKLFVQIIMENELSNMSLNDFRKAIIDNLPQSISREAVEKLINRYKRLEEWEKDNIWWCALRCFIKDLNSLLPNKSNDSD